MDIQEEIKYLKALSSGQDSVTKQAKNQNLLVVGGVSAAIGGFMFFGGGMEMVGQQMSHDASWRQVRATEERLSRNDAIARRWAESALIIVSLDNRSKYIRLSEDLPVVDPESGVPLPAGRIVGDIDGCVGVLGAGGFPEEVLCIHWESRSERVEWLRRQIDEDEHSAVFSNIGSGNLSENK